MWQDHPEISENSSVLRKCSRFENIWEWEPNWCCTNPIKIIILISYGFYFLGRWTNGNWNVISTPHQVIFYYLLIFFKEKARTHQENFGSLKT